MNQDNQTTQPLAENTQPAAVLNPTNVEAQPKTKQSKKAEKRAARKAKKAKVETIVQTKPEVIEPETPAAEVKPEAEVVVTGNAEPAQTKPEEAGEQKAAEKKPKVVPAKEQTPKVLFIDTDPKKAANNEQYFGIRHSFDSEEIVSRKPYLNRAVADEGSIIAFAKKVIEKVREKRPLTSAEVYFTLCNYCQEQMAKPMTYDEVVDLFNSNPNIMVMAHKSNISSGSVAKGDNTCTLDVQFMSHKAFTYVGSKYSQLQYMDSTRVLNKKPHERNFGAEQSRTLSFQLGANFLAAMKKTDPNYLDGQAIGEALKDCAVEANLVKAQVQA